MIRLVFQNSRRSYHIDVDTWQGAFLAVAMLADDTALVQFNLRGGV